jgi:UDP-N-acetylglucosamine 2-epimerase (non-hydrolysing)
MKIAPVIKEITVCQNNGIDIKFKLIHTGQHYDKMMSQTFFDELSIPEPDINLEVGSGTQAFQTGSIMVKYEDYLLKNPCDVVIVVGDVTSTMACSIVAKKLNTEVVHIEAGIRSYDMTMPEEINRIVTDSLADHYYTTTKWASDNLIRLGVKKDKIHLVGNTMIDTLYNQLPKIKRPEVFDEFNLREKQYITVTLHRPNNVDDVSKLRDIIEEIIASSREYQIIFPVHPRTRKNLEKIGLKNRKLVIINPLGYKEFIYLINNSLAVFTDSGGITEETTVLGIPCITLRNNTERPETVEIGTNELIGTDPSAIKPIFDKLFNNQWKKGRIPEFWDGGTSTRILKSLLEIYNKTTI